MRQTLGKVFSADLKIGQPRFRVLGHPGRVRAAILCCPIAALRPKGALDLGRPSKIFSHPRYLI